MPGYGARYWAERTPLARRPHYGVLRGALTADVVIIGGGLTGATAAYVLAKGGLDVVLVEANRLASGATAAGLGSLLPEPAPFFRAAEASVGLRRAKAAWQTARTSALDMAALLRRLSIRCELESSALVSTASRADLVERLRRELAGRKAAGVDTSAVQARAAAALGGEVLAGMKREDVFTFDPVRATLGLARAAEAAGARLFERSAVRRTSFTRKTADVHLATGSVRTRGVFVATGTPGSLLRSLLRHVRVSEAYAVVTEPLSLHMRRAVGRRDLMAMEAAESPRWLRWLGDDRALFAGAAGPVPATRLRDRHLVQRTGQLMYELSLRHPSLAGLPARWSWAVPVVTTPDGLPWIGHHRNYPFHFLAVASGWHADGLAMFSAKSALRHFKGEPVAGDDTFGFGR